ncbi:MAG: hypothetical protein ACM3TN_13615 [Alphaproteobacteria bacterium]
MGYCYLVSGTYSSKRMFAKSDLVDQQQQFALDVELDYLIGSPSDLKMVENNVANRLADEKNRNTSPPNVYSIFDVKIMAFSLYQKEVQR